MQTLKTINEEDGITIVVTLHQVDYAQKYCQRGVALQDGKLYFDKPIKDINNAQLASLYGSSEPESNQKIRSIFPSETENSTPKFKTA